MLYLQRLKKLRHFLASWHNDAFLVSAYANLRYLSGFTSRECHLLISKKENIFLGDFRYNLQAKKELGSSFEIIMIKDTLAYCLKELLPKLKINSLCFEENHTSVGQYHRLKTELGKKIKLIPVKGIIEELRQIKSAQELEIIQTAVDITKKSFLQLKPFIKDGVAEIFLKNKLEQILKNNGADRTSFDIIVASGKNAAMPHAQATSKNIRQKEPIIIDAGCEYRGYKSDLTRTFFLGKISTYINYYKLVAAAQDSAIKLIRPLVKIKKIDQTARAVFEKAKLEKYFGHALGHGVGLEIHEAPSISAKNEGCLKEGMLFTIEPGIYIPQWGGIRLEEMVFVTKKGYKIL